MRGAGPASLSSPRHDLCVTNSARQPPRPKMHTAAQSLLADGTSSLSKVERSFSKASAFGLAL